MRVAFAAVAAVALGCAGGGAQLAPEGERGRWREIQGEHFLLRTDLSSTEARAALEALESTQAALVAFAWPGHPPPPVRQIVHLVGRSRDLPTREEQRAGIRPGHDGLESAWVAWGPLAEWREREKTGAEPPFLPNPDHLPCPRIVMVGDHLVGLLADRLARHYLGESPRWLVQGLTWYLASARVEPDGRSAALGQPNPDSLERLRAGDLVPARELLEDGAAPPPPLDPSSHRRFMTFNRTAWLLVHYLFSTQKEWFAEYRRRIAWGSSPAHALSALRGVKLDRLDSLLEAYARTDRWPVLRVPLPGSGPAQERILDEPEALLARAQLLLAWRAPGYDGAGPAAGPVEQALRIAPAMPAARRVQARIAPRERRLSPARAVAVADPDDWRSWVLVADALPEAQSSAGERASALARAKDLSARSARVVLGQARALFASGQGQAARPLLAEALKLDPYDADALRMLALLHQGRGRCREAAFAWALVHGAGGVGRDELATRIAELQGCVDAR